MIHYFPRRFRLTNDIFLAENVNTLPLTRKRAIKAIVNSTVSILFETIIDVALKNARTNDTSGNCFA